MKVPGIVDARLRVSLDPRLEAAAFQIESHRGELVPNRNSTCAAGWFTSGSVNFFLCFGGFLRLSGMTRSPGGMPIPRRASRRASLCARNRSFFFLAIIDAMNLSRFHGLQVRRALWPYESERERLASKAKECKASKA